MITIQQDHTHKPFPLTHAPFTQMSQTRSPTKGKGSAVFDNIKKPAPKVLESSANKKVLSYLLY